MEFPKSPCSIHVAIVGAGLGGLAAAISLVHSGHKVTIFEQAPQLAEVGAGIQIPPNASRILQQWGLLEQIRDVSVEPVDFILRSYRDGHILSRQNMSPHAVDTYGSPYLHIHRADYHRILVQEAQRLGIKIMLDCRVIAVDFTAPAIIILDQPTFYADLVIGADGLKSVCREALLARADPPYLTGDLAYRVIIDAEDMRNHPLLKDLVDNPAITYWMGPESHVVSYLLQRGTKYNIVMICPDNLPELVNTAKADIQEMRDFFVRWDPKLKALLELVKDSSKWRLQDSREMRRWSHPAGRFTLLGDACHATLPYLAQGAAQAVEDGATLGAILAQIEHKAQIHDALIIFEAARKQRTSHIVRGSAALREIFHIPDGPIQEERDRQLAEELPFEGFPNRWADPVFQKWLFDYDVYSEVNNMWKLYRSGQFPGTRGAFGT